MKDECIRLVKLLSFSVPVRLEKFNLWTVVTYRIIYLILLVEGIPALNELNRKSSADWKDDSLFNQVTLVASTKNPVKYYSRRKLNGLEEVRGTVEQC